MKALRILKLEDYVAGVGETGELGQLILAHTVGETYFFRDAGQFSLLRSEIIPKLIRDNAPTKMIRIWSAGCSTGEEAYSLAFVVNDLLPKGENWKIVVFGTDVNPAAIARAREGKYGSWSFRGVDAHLQSEYFKRNKAQWIVRDDIRDLVSFSTLNLLKDTFPEFRSGLYELDLVLCRNVFIYFDRSAVTTVVRKIRDTLRGGGYFMTGHAELYDQDLSGFNLRAFDSSVVYQKRHNQMNHSPKLPENPTWREQTTPVPKGTIEPSEQPIPTAKSSMGDVDPFADALLEFNRGKYQDVVILMEAALALDPEQVRFLHLLARSQASLGRYESAIESSNRAIDADAFGEEPYFLLAHISGAKGNPYEAIEFLKKCIYLSPRFAPAYIELGALYEQAGETARAEKMFSSALELLDSNGPQETVDPYSLQTVEELKDELLSRITDNN
jgi:chemotaxis protein methyltransferase CheR